ncbi:MAG: patatin-like phospholipase family protein [Oscillospiraceae bacterium]
MPKRAVVLGGGGARGPYQIGVWKALRELSIDYHIVTGSSVGALNGALMVQGDYDKGVEMWESLSLRNIVNLSSPPDQEASIQDELRQGIREAVENRGLDVSPLESLLRDVISPERFYQSPVDYGLVTVQFPLYTPLHLTKAEIPPEKLVDYLMASASYFPLFQAKVIDGKRHIDGAYNDNIPARLALRCGAEELIVVDLAARGLVRPLREKVPVTYIRSRWFLGEIMEFDTSTAEEKLILGYHDCLKAFRRKEGCSYTFHPGESKKNVLRLRNAFQTIRQKCGVSILKQYWKLPQEHEETRGYEKRFYRYEAEDYTIGHAVTSVAEITGELLGISPYEVYTLHRFNRLLLEAASQTTLSSPALSQRDRDTSASTRYGARRVVRKFYTMLERACQTGKPPEAMWALVGVSPREFLAAYYLLALRMTYGSL